MAIRRVEEYRKEAKKIICEGETNIHLLSKKIGCSVDTANRLCFELLAEGSITAKKEAYSGKWIIKKI